MNESHEPKSVMKAYDPPPDGTTTGDFMQPKAKGKDAQDANAGTLNVPTREQLQHMTRNSDQVEISQQEIEQTVGHHDESDENAADGDIPLPAGFRQDELGHDGESNDDLLRADMVNGGG